MLSKIGWVNSYNPCGAAYVPPSDDLVFALLQDLVTFCNNDSLPPLVQAAIAHAQFETIHPFVDGNGRVGRILIHVILRRRGLCPNVVPPVSLVLATRGADYIKGLTSFRHEGAAQSDAATAGLNDWLSFFSICIQSACRDALAFEQKIAAVKREWLERVGPKCSSTVVQLIDAMAARPLFTAAHMVDAVKKLLLPSTLP